MRRTRSPTLKVLTFSDVLEYGLFLIGHTDNMHKEHHLGTHQDNTKTHVVGEPSRSGTGAKSGP